MVKITHLDARSESLDVQHLPLLQNHVDVLAHLGTHLGNRGEREFPFAL